MSTVSPGLGVMLAQRLFFTPPHVPLRDEERAVLARGEPFSFQFDGKRVAGHVWGDGPAVLLVHGWGGHSGQMTALVDPLVAAGFKAVAVDMPAHGESAGKVSSLVHFTGAIEGAAAQVGPFHGVVAHSFGAATSTYAMSRGMPVARVVFFAPPAAFETFWAQFRAGLGVSDQIWQRLLRRSERWLKVNFDGITPIELAPGMTTPLLVVHAVNDRQVPFEEGVELVSRWPGAVMFRNERLGHMRILRNERSIAEAVRFLSSDV